MYTLHSLPSHQQAAEKGGAHCLYISSPRRLLSRADQHLPVVNMVAVPRHLVGQQLVDEHPVPYTRCRPGDDQRPSRRLSGRQAHGGDHTDLSQVPSVAMFFCHWCR